MIGIIKLVFGILLTLSSLFLSLSLLIYIGKEKDDSAYYAYLLLVPLMVLGILLIRNNLKRKFGSLTKSSGFKIDHSPQLNDFISFYIETRVNGELLYETVIDYLSHRYTIINVKTKESVEVIFEEGKDETHLELEIRAQVEKLIQFPSNNKSQFND